MKLNLSLSFCVLFSVSVMGCTKKVHSNAKLKNVGVVNTLHCTVDNNPFTRLPGENIIQAYPNAAVVRP